MRYRILASVAAGLAALASASLNATAQAPSPTQVADSLAAAIAAMDNPQMRERAAKLGAAIRGEQGVTAAVDFIEARARRPLDAARF